MREFEIGDKVEFCEGRFVVEDKISANPGYFNYVLRSPNGTRRIGMNNSQTIFLLKTFTLLLVFYLFYISI